MDGVSPLTYVFTAFLALYAFLAFGAGKIAEKQGRNFIGWFIFSLIISPFLVILFLLLLGESTASAVKKQPAPREVIKVRCSYCREAVDESAKFCPECGTELWAATA